MTDKKLLELAAKAIGIEVVWLESSLYGPTMARVEVNSGEGEITEPWDPLTDDGDALRLAVKLNLWGAVRDGYQHLDSDKDPYAATRRAIVRAAAEIGKELK